MADNDSITTYTPDEVEEFLPGVDGREVVYTLTSSEIAGFVELSNVEIELDDMVDTFRKRALGEMINELSKNDMQGFVNSVVESSAFTSEAEAGMFFQKVAQFEELRILFWNNLRTFLSGSRPIIWNEYLDIVKGYRVVVIAKKFRTK